MTKFNRILLMCAVSGFALYGCGDDDVVTDAGTMDTGVDDAGPDDDTGVEDAGPGDDTGVEDAGMAMLRGADNPPTLGTQIDRAGRAAITAGTIGTFMPSAMDAERNGLKDAYNANADESTWVDTHRDQMVPHLAILDGLDGTCGNQLLNGDSDPAVAADYELLATVLSDDRLFVNANGTACGQYLAVEANVTGLLENDDCGGRTPNHDVMDVTYTVLVAGGAALVAGDIISDGLTADNVTHSDTEFPFFAAAE